jgi:hypothetical protein
MRIAVLVATTAFLGQAAPETRDGLRSYSFTPPAHELKLWLPLAYNPDDHIARMYVRDRTTGVPEGVTLRLDYSTTKRPEPPPLPGQADLQKVDGTLTDIIFTPSVSTWRGRPVSMARYVAFVHGKVGVYGRVAWLPLEPGTVVLDLYAEPALEATMDRDWQQILASIQSPETALTLRERAPRRWMTSMILGGLGCLVGLIGIIMILARMNEAIGGGIVFMGLVLPVVPLGYALFRLPECWRGLVVFLVGAATFGASLLVAR